MVTAPPAPAAIDVDQDPVVAGFVRRVDEGHFDEAVRYAAERLDRRVAVWWGALCVWNKLRSLDPEACREQAAAVDAAVAWAIDPSEDNRLAAKEAGLMADPKTAAGALATAPFWSGGSVSLPGQPEVPPPAGAAARFVTNAVLMSAAAASAAQRRDSLRQSLRMAAELFAGDVPDWVSTNERAYQ